MSEMSTEISARTNDLIASAQEMLTKRDELLQRSLKQTDDALDAARLAIKRTAELSGILEECLEYFEDREDVNDGDYGIPEANTEMRMASMIKEALYGREF